MPKPYHYRARLQGKVAIVTGAGSQESGVGTGSAIAIVFAGEGAKVCLLDRDATRAELTRAKIIAEGGDASVIIGDVTEDTECARLVAEATLRYGGVDILVNNVGIASAPDKLDTFDEDAWNRVISVNLKSAVLMSRHAIPEMIRRHGGAIVNISSIAATRGFGFGVAYGPSKAAMSALSRDLAVMYGGEGIRVNTIAPGHIFTPLSHGLLGDEARAVRRKAGPLGIEGDAWDVAAATLFFASDEARFITATCLAVDGGVAETGSLIAHAMITR
jgi:NAD(P)-dependent dehydrogenase (short-subunit alcohol dehydrogenase family)